MSLFSRLAASAVAILSITFVHNVFAQQNSQQYADLMLLETAVVTMNAEDDTVEAVAFRGDKVLAVGSSETLRKFIGPETHVWQLRSKAVVPSFKRAKQFAAKGIASHGTTLGNCFKKCSYARLEKNIQGKFSPGEKANFVVLSIDPRAVEPAKIKDIEVEMMGTGGKVVYRSTTALPDYLESIGPPQIKLARGQRLVGRLCRGANLENSGIVRSRTQDDVYWLVNDSGNAPCIHAVHCDGTTCRHVKMPEEPGTLVDGANNRDWEDIDVLEDGTIVVADTGNNDNDRRDLRLYLVSEPNAESGHAKLLKKVDFRYPDQKQFPAPRTDFNFDCESIFTIGNNVYFLTKHRSDTATKAYRLNNLSDEKTHELELLERREMGSQVTAAGALADGSKLVVATYEMLWLFDVKDPNHPLANPIARLPYNGVKVEAVCFDGSDRVLFSDEATALVYEARLKDFEAYEGK